MTERVNAGSLLRSAVIESNEKAVRFLLKHGADANAPSSRNHHNNSKSDNQDENVSHRQKQASCGAIGDDTHGYAEMNEIFSRYRSSSFSSCVVTPNPTTLTPRSSYSFNARNRKLLLQQQEQSHGHGKSMRPMHIAAANGRSDIVEMLISYGGEIDAVMDGDYTPLMIALLYQHYDIVKIFANQGANVNARSRGGKTPMYFAVKTKQSAMVQLLLENGANPNSATDHGVTPLHIAVERKLDEVVEMLLDAGANVNVTTKTGVTPLHCAAVKGQTDITEMILRHGADVGAIMNKGEIDVTPLLWVTECERKKITDVVKKYAPKSKSSGFYGTVFKKIWRQFGVKKL